MIISRIEILAALKQKLRLKPREYTDVFYNLHLLFTKYILFIQIVTLIYTK